MVWGHPAYNMKNAHMPEYYKVNLTASFNLFSEAKFALVLSVRGPGNCCGFFQVPKLGG